MIFSLIEVFFLPLLYVIILIEYRSGKDKSLYLNTNVKAQGRERQAALIFNF